ncbi:MAG: MMPL family transporter, partial [Gammaproteobacteria bacterium]|nr:MMPL family transporter [Gammaproteobacteria bacterium]
MLKDAATPFFDFLSTIIIKFPKTILLLTIFASSFSIAHVNKLTIDTSPQAFFHPDDPILLHYDQFLDQFERDEVAVIAIETDNVIAQEFLQLLSRLHEDLENNVPYVDEVISLINTTSIKGKADELIVEDLLEHWPQNKIELDRLRQDILSHPLYPKLLISDDARYTAVVVRAKAFSSDLVSSEDDLLAGFEDTHSNSSRKDYTKLSSKQNSEFGNKIIEISKKYETDTIRFYTAGLAIVNNELLIKLNAEVPLFTSFALFLIAIFLYLLFRRIGGVLMPLTVVLTALVTTIGYMAFFGKPFTVFTQILPSFLLAVGVGDAVHLLSIFYRDFAKTGDKLASLRHAMRHTGMAMFMTSITTAAGLLSFAVSEIAAIGYLGVFGALGVMLAFFYSIILLPTLIVLLPIKTKEVDNNGKLNLAIDNFISRLALISTRHPGSVILTSSFILVVALFGASQLRFHYDAVSWFPKDDPLRVATQV